MECCICGRNEDDNVKYMTSITTKNTTFIVCYDCKKEICRRTKIILKRPNYTNHEFITELLIYKKSFKSQHISNIPYIAAAISITIICIIKLMGLLTL